MISLVVFLGNYGREYEKTRHNMAWLFGDSLPFADQLSWQNGFKGKYAVIDITRMGEWAYQYKLALSKKGMSVAIPETAPKRIYFLRPETYMNRSGDSIIEMVHFYKIRTEEILIVHDELELPCGTVSFKWSGGLGGHNGLRSTKNALGTSDFWRLRFGIGRPDQGNIADYVLSEFSEDEQIILSQTFPQAGILLTRILLSEEPKDYLSEWHKKKLSM